MYGICHQILQTLLRPSVTSVSQALDSDYDVRGFGRNRERQTVTTDI